MTKRVFAGIIFISVLLMFCFGAIGFLIRTQRDQGPQLSLQPVTISIVQSEASALLLVAKQKKFFERYGLDVRIDTTAQTGGAAVRRLRDHASDLIMLTDYGVVSNLAGSSDVVVIGSVARDAAATKVIARRDARITGTEDLRGKRIGVSDKTIADYQLGLFLDKNHIPVSEVRLFDFAPEELEVALLDGRVDAVVVWNPFAAKIEDRLQTNGISWISSYDSVDLMLVADREMELNPTIFDGVLRALIDAEVYTRSHIDEAQNIVRQESYASSEYMKRIWSDYEFTVTFSQELIVRMEYQLEWLRTYKHIPIERSVDLFYLFDPDYLKQIDSYRVSFIQ